MTDELYRNSKPLYDEAYKLFPRISESDVPAFDEIMKTPDGKRAVGIALRLLRNKGKKIGREDAIGMVRKPSLEFLDYVKRGFDQIISKEEAQGPTALGKSMRDLRNALREQLDAVSPEYKAARAQYAGDLEVIDALRTGRERFNRLQPEEVEMMMAEMSNAEKSAFRAGAAQRLLEDINRASTDVNAARRITGSPSTRKKVEALIEDPNDRRVFMAALETETEMFLRDQPTVRKGEAARVKRQVSESGPLTEAAETVLGGRFTLTGWAVRLLSQLGSDHLTEKQADEVIRVLRQSDPDELYRMLARMRGREKRKLGKGAKAAVIGGGAVAGATLAHELEEPQDAER